MHVRLLDPDTLEAVLVQSYGRSRSPCCMSSKTIKPRYSCTGAAGMRSFSKMPLGWLVSGSAHDF